jgi:hypothetical protein
VAAATGIAAVSKEAADKDRCFSIGDEVRRRRGQIVDSGDGTEGIWKSESFVFVYAP